MNVVDHVDVGACDALEQARGHRPDRLAAHAPFRRKSHAARVRAARPRSPAARKIDNVVLSERSLLPICSHVASLSGGRENAGDWRRKGRYTYSRMRGAFAGANIVGCGNESIDKHVHSIEVIRRGRRRSERRQVHHGHAVISQRTLPRPIRELRNAPCTMSARSIVCAPEVT
jgi:hypothetical protein